MPRTYPQELRDRAIELLLEDPDRTVFAIMEQLKTECDRVPVYETVRRWLAEAECHLTTKGRTSHPRAVHQRAVELYIKTGTRSAAHRQLMHEYKDRRISRKFVARCVERAGLR